jgi:putative membrane-bound dehydrogenase-like protein
MAAAWISLALAGAVLNAEPAATAYSVGVAKIDITPGYPVRLSGFGIRRAESEGVTQRIWAKALVIDDGEPAVLLTVDNLGVPAYLMHVVAARLAKKVGLRPERLAVTATHTHTAPMLRGVAPTLFGQPIPREHQDHIDRYTAELTDKLEKVALAALADRMPARLSWGIGTVGFAVNRRTKRGPVDHDLPVLLVRDLQGKVRAVYVSYACHCVTLSHNKISGDWAGYAQEAIQDAYPAAIALVSIGCGADANPSSGVTGDRTDLAVRQGAEIAAEVKRLLHGFLAPVTGKLTAVSKHIELPLDTVPTRAEWQERAERKDAIGYHARVQLDRLDRGESLRTKIDYPIQTWAFGDSLAMVFLPGEVVVDYSLRLKRELDGLRLWINAYANDAPCYIPSERVLREGGYEGGGAMVYYDVPTRLKPGLEQRTIDNVHAQIGKRFQSPFDSQRTGGSRPLSPQQSLATIRTKKDLTVELVAAEPLVVSPVAIDWGPDGRLWVAEMIDYPAGKNGDYKPGGRIRVLEDTDGDDKYDKATVFLDNIPFPTGVTAWRKGVLICAAPDILYAEDTKRDGKADMVRKLFSGFGTDNYQARVNSLEYGLDGWVYGSCGIFGGTIRSFALADPGQKKGTVPLSPRGQSPFSVVRLGNRDFRIQPDTGLLEPATGRTQQGRVRDDWGNWFGCDNTNLCWHYPLADHYLRRNPRVPAPRSAVLVPDDPNPNRLYPIRAQLQLFKLSGPPGQTTAACGLGIYRDDLLGPEYQGNAFVCEPVNLLIHRLLLSPRGSTFSGHRAANETESEFLASTDNWFRPVQVRTGPDGCLWVVDMYRYVIEHPRWIPPEDLAKVEVRAGSTMGRIFRVRSKERKPRPIPRLEKEDSASLVAALDSPNGWQRDMAGQMLLWRADRAVVKLLEKMVSMNPRPETRLQALCVLDGLGGLRTSTVRAALADKHPGVRRHAVRLSEKFLATSPELGDALFKLIDDPDDLVRLQLACSLGGWRDTRAGRALATLALQYADDAYLRGAVLSSVGAANLPEVLAGVFTDSARSAPPEPLVKPLLGLATSLGDKQSLPAILEPVTTAHREHFARWQWAALIGVLDALESQGQSTAQLGNEKLVRRITEMLREAHRGVLDVQLPERDRLAAIDVLGREPTQLDADLSVLGQLLVPQNPVSIQTAAIDGLGRIPDKRVAALLIAGWKSYTPSLKMQVLDLLLSRAAWQQELLRGIEHHDVPAANIDAKHRERLLNQKDERVRMRAAKLFASAISPDRQKVLESYRAVASMPGDRTRGRAIFAKTCAVCHRLQDVGHEVGPDLAALSNKTPQYLLTAILVPNQSVDARYLEYLAVTKTGRVLTGILANEAATSITLKGQEAKEQVLLRSELEELKSTGKSLMPEGLEKDLSRQDLADLIAFLTGSPNSH